MHPAADVNLIIGANGAGKTSVLEAVFLLGRGRSFRPGTNSGLIQTGSEAFTVFADITAEAASAGLTHRLGVSGSRGGLDIHVDGEAGGTTADLAAGLPVQVIDPQVHDLIQGGPQNRRRFVDWGVFHVKHEFLASWRRYRRTLQQRNSALRLAGAKKGANSRDSVTAWDSELVESGNSVDLCRREYLELFAPVVARISDQLLGQEANCRYLPGWAGEKDFAAALADSWARDSALGSTQVGPHRAEMAIDIQGRAARHRLSRGQQKLLAASLVLAQSEFVAAAADRQVALLVDEPAAELDQEHLESLLLALPSPGVQLFCTALTRDALPVFTDPCTFHVERGEVTTLV